VVREIDGEYWFYGAYGRNANKAYDVTKEIDGLNSS